MSFSVPREPVEVTFYQCSRCGYTSALRQNAVSHVTSVETCRSTGAGVLRQKCACTVLPAGDTRAAGNGRPRVVGLTTEVIDRSQVGDYNHMVNNNISVHVHPNLVYVGSEEERRALFAVFEDPANLRELAVLEPEEIPAALFRMWKGGDASDALKNIRVLGNKVEEQRGPDTVVSVPRTRFVRRTVGDMLDAVVKAPSGAEAAKASVQKKGPGAGQEAPCEPASGGGHARGRVA